MAFNRDVFILAVAFAAGNLARACRNVTQCDCGQQCVDVMDLKLCHSRTCVCLQGCGVGNIFIPAGVTRPDTYCNWCRCGSDPQDGIPMCTRRAWCDVDENSPIYQYNPACDLDLEQDELFQQITSL